MSTELDTLLPELKEFSVPDVQFKVIDPLLLPEQTRKAFDAFTADSAAPAAFCAYSHDYARFCKLVRQGDIDLG
ncbi:hypothetical protein MD588_24645 [Photobacterium sp. SDRW27]|uniref:hypothetical protein n=1 Tax=Photobacterium obscurum TaxID=2829490 RepID=UPI002242EE44|nr:hypothetical protein [Photobacterium obscurum]MCW8331986.1 hypothetical protein [Photobacterium obscurum]